MTWNEQQEQEEAEMLQTYWSSLAASGEDVPPAGLDAEIAVVARHGGTAFKAQAEKQ